MTDRYLAVMLAARQLASRDNVNLAPWTRERWSEWLSARRDPENPPCSAHTLVRIELTCFDDLQLHVGFFQLLPLLGAGCSPLFSLPTEEAVRIFRARARREEWDGLVQIISDSEAEGLLSGLPEHEPVVVFVAPAVLSRAHLTRIGAARSGLSTMPNGASSEAFFVGSVSNYRKWKNEIGSTGEGLEPSILREASWNPKTSLPVPAPHNVNATSVSETPLSVQAPPVPGSAERLPCGGAEEMLVHEGSGERRRTIFRQLAVQSPDKPTTIRMPGRLMTTFAQPVTLERRGADGQSVLSECAFHVPPNQIEPWMVTAFLNKGGGGNPMMRAFAQGIACRLAYAEDEHFMLRDVPIVWGVLRGSDRILARARAQGLYYFYADHSYFDRGHGNSYRITRNRYEAGPIRECPPDRLTALNVDIRPWRKSGRDIIVCPPTDFFAAAHDCADWLDKTLSRLRGVTDRPVTIRNKPKPGDRAIPLDEALQSAHALVTHSSNVAIEAACLGTPVFVSEASAAAPIGRTDLDEIEAPVYPDRTPWLAHLAYNQFTFEEIRDGTAWRMLLALEERPHV